MFDGKNYNKILEKTAEVQLLFNSDRLIGTTGLYSYRDDRRFLRNNWFTNEIQRAVNPTLFAATQRFLGIPSFVPVPPIVPDVHTLTYSYAKGWAAFAEWTYKVTDKFSATAGVRYNKDESTTRGFTPRDPLPVLCCEAVYTDLTNGGPPTSSVSGDFTNTAPRVSLQYQWNPEVMTYVTYAEGFNRGGGTQTSAGVISFTPEKLKNIEAGVRSDLFDRRLRVNSSVFYSKYTGIQVTQDLNFFNVVRNAGEGTAKGIEIEGQWLLGDAFSVNYGLGYLKTEYTKLAAGVTDPKVGQVFPFAPKYSASVGAQYDIHVANGGGVALRADYGWQDDQNTGVDNSSVFIPAYGLLSARVTYRAPDDKWDVALYGTNLSNEFYRLNGYAIPALGLDTGTTGRPREWGLTFSFRFN
jgi:iron complex outermembrane receptor protein